MLPFLRIMVVVFSVILRPFRRRWKQGRPTRCLLVGYGGANNTGAEVHTAEAIKQMRAVAEDQLEIVVTSLNRRRSRRYMHEDERLAIVEIPSFFVFRLARLVMNADVVVLVEGYCFMQSFSQVLFWLFMFAADLAQRLKVPTAAYAVDAGELSPANRRWAVRVADRLDLLMMRTEAAAEVMRMMGVDREIIVTADTAFTVESETGQWAKNRFRDAGFDTSRPVMGIAFEEFFWWPVVPRLAKFLTGQRDGRYKAFYYHSWSPDRCIHSEDMKRAIASFADWAGRELNMEIALFAMDRVNHDPCADVIRLMTRPAAMFDADRYDGREMTALLRACKLLITCEYHALLLSMGAGVPVIGLGHDERIRSVMNELGMADDYHIHFTDDDMKGRLKTASQRILVEEESVHRHILEADRIYQKRNARNAECFRLFIERSFPASG